MPEIVLTCASIGSVTSISIGVRARAFKHRVDGDERKLDAREKIDADPLQRHPAQRDQRADDHHGQNGPADRKIGNPHVCLELRLRGSWRAPRLSSFTATPSAICPRFEPTENSVPSGTLLSNLDALAV